MPRTAAPQQSGGFEVIVELMDPGGQRMRPCSAGVVAVVTDHLLAGPVDLELSLALVTDYFDVELPDSAENFLDLITVAPPESGLCR